MLRKLVIAIAAVAIAYAAGWTADGALNDDGCAPARARETDRIRDVSHFFPARTDCRVRSRSGRFRFVERGDSDVFWATFVAVLVIAFALLAALAALLRGLLILGAVVGAAVVIFG